MPEVIQVGVDYNLYEGWYFIRTTADSYWANGDVKDELMAWVYGEFCAIIDGCDEAIIEEPEEAAVIMMQGVMQNPSSSHIINIEDDLDDSFMSLVYCHSACYDTDTYSDWELQGYDGTTPYDPIYKYTDYDVGMGGGQFMYVVDADQWNNYEKAPPADQNAAWVE